MGFKKGNEPWNKGRKWSKEIKKKISQSHKGKKLSEKQKKKISESNKGKHQHGLGKKFSKETKDKISSALKGIKRGKMSEEQKMKISKNRRGIRIGKNHPNWKGGVTELGLAIRESARYKEWRMKVFVRDNFKCILCENNGHNEAHHKKRFSIIIKENKIKNIRQAEKCKELWDIDNGVTLCKKCHGEVDDYKNRFLGGD